ncbi:MAG: rhodanese-like domain-containing protein [Vampirovibrionales bacterium]|nr:rhodanese-like domain-containing protein [Vampirovibrionales bacterium]
MNSLTDIQQLSSNDLETLIQKEEAGSFQILDVRTPQEHHYLGYIPQAILMPLHTLPERQGELDRNKTTVLVCEHGVRSMDASLYLWHLGFRNLANLTHGMAAWTGIRVHSS